MPARARRRSHTAKYELAILAEYDHADRGGKGALLRRKKLHTSLISEWRKPRNRGALKGLSATKAGPPVDARDREIEQLKAANAKLSGELDRTRRVVKVHGRLSALLEDLSSESASSDSERRR